MRSAFCSPRDGRNEAKRLGSQNLGWAFRTGLRPRSWRWRQRPYPYCEDTAAQVDLGRFSATTYLDQAYDYAFQVGRYWDFADDTAQDVHEFILGANPQASNGDPSPLSNLDGLCRRAADTAFGRRSVSTILRHPVLEFKLGFLVF